MGPVHHLSRREFIRTGAVAAASGWAIPYIIPSGVLAQDGEPGANGRIGVGAIGVGRQGGALVGALAGMVQARLVAVADVNLPRAQEVGAKYGAETYQDYRRLLERDDIDAVISATVEPWRAITCIHACQAGKDVYAEKPLSWTIREGRLMVEAVRKYDRVLQTGSQQRSQKENRFGCELVRNGRIGKVQRVIANNYPSPWECALPEQPVPDGLDWDFWCGPTEPVPFNADLYIPRGNPGWLSFRTYSGGEMTGWGAHGFDQVQWVLGMDESGPVEVWTEGEPFSPPTYGQPESRDRGNGVCSQPRVFMRYPGDIVMELGNGPGGGAIFIGDKGTLTIDRGKCVSDPPGIAAEPIRDDEIRLAVSDDHIGNWLDCIKSRERPICDVEVGHRSATVCHLGNLARQLGRRLQWDPVAERFVGDEEANQHLDRPRRAKYDLPATI